MAADPVVWKLTEGVEEVAEVEQIIPVGKTTVTVGLV
jgi:hypothetical protein